MPHGETGPRRVVVGVDGSLSARIAVDHAVERAKGGTVVLACVVSPVPDLIVRSLSEPDDTRQDDARRLLDRFASDVEGVDVEAVVLRGAPASAIADLARERDADEIVVGSRGMGRFAAALGSVSHALLAEADRPVVVVPRAAADHPGVDRRGGPCSVVVGYDGSAAARAALAYAARRAQGGRIIAVNAFQPAPDWLGSPNYDRTLIAYQQHGRELLAALEAEGVPGVDLRTSLLEGPAARAIVAAADARDADEIVLGSRGMGAVRGVLGSVSHAVLHEADRPVVIIPAGATQTANVPE